MLKERLKLGGLYSLSQLNIGNVAEVVSIKGDNVLMLRRLFDLGVTQGVNLIVKKIAPLGGLISFEIRDYELVLRNLELQNIIVRLKK